MGDLANMTDNDGRVNGFRLLRWLRGRAEMYRHKEEDARVRGYVSSRYCYCGRAVMLEEMASDLERELTPPDYPEDDGDDGASPQELADRDFYKRHPGADDTVDLDDPALTGGDESP